MAKCAWCGRDDAGLHPLMSADHLSCQVCYIVWYEDSPRTPEELVKLSLGKRGEEIEGWKREKK